MWIGIDDGKGKTVIDLKSIGGIVLEMDGNQVNVAFGHSLPKEEANEMLPKFAARIQMLFSKEEKKKITLLAFQTVAEVQEWTGPIKPRILTPNAAERQQLG